METDKKITVFMMTLIMLIVVVLCLVVFFIGKCSAQSAVVSFNDAEHLAALQDSVVGVIDSTFTTSDSYLEGYTKSYFYGNSQSDGYVYYFRWIITCRRLVGVTVVRDFKLRMVDRTGILRQAGSPGRAIIFYESVKP